MPRLIRRRSRWEKLKDALNLSDLLLWLSEELETRDWDSKQVATPLALAFHVVFLIARANTGARSSRDFDDVFADESTGSGWLGYLATLLVYMLGVLSVANALYTFLRLRHYRLFESNIETAPSTPSATRVRVDSSPVASSPLRFLSSILGDPSAQSRAHPDPTRDVWQLAVWDPIPVCLQLFCFFSPGNVFIYWLLLPTTAMDPHPSITIVKTLALQIAFSAQLYIMQSKFSQQEKDSAIIHKEVMSEYDIKFVHPRLNPLMREVGTQFSGPESLRHDKNGDVDTYTPTVLIKREFRTNPNPNYLKHVDPDNLGSNLQRTFSPMPSFIPASLDRELSSSPIKQRPNHGQAVVRAPALRKSMAAMSTGTSTGDGGSLGVYSHASSPLKKATSLYDMQHTSTPRNSYEMASREIAEQRQQRSQSPSKVHQPAMFNVINQQHGHRGLGKEEISRRTSAPLTAGVRSRHGEAKYSSRW